MFWIWEALYKCELLLLLFIIREMQILSKCWLKPCNFYGHNFVKKIFIFLAAMCYQRCWALNQQLLHLKQVMNFPWFTAVGFFLFFFLGAGGEKCMFLQAHNIRPRIPQRKTTLSPRRPQSPHLGTQQMTWFSSHREAIPTEYARSCSVSSHPHNIAYLLVL